jgi:pimeloyl-ACP methyl ester carboxylesterase
MPASYLERFAAGVSGSVTVREIPGAGHLAELDAPEAVARVVLDFLAA